MADPLAVATREQLAELVVEHMVAIMRGECTLTRDEIRRYADDGPMCHVLTGLHYLSQDLELERARTQALTDQLAARVAVLEQRDRENEVLAAELRRQIGQRAAELALALARLAAAGGGAALSPGDEVMGRYLVVRPLGAGAMGEVYEVERKVDGRRLALKQLRNRGASLEMMARFAREAQIAARVSHPNLVAVVDVDAAQDGALCLVLELVDGTSLDRCRERHGDPTWARPILAQVAAGLAALHAAGVVHRDLKPANVLLANGSAKITDFGIAHLQDPHPSTTWMGAEASHATSFEQLTRKGEILGTPLYMAPEVARGHVETAADVWSFAVLGHELLTGRLPFEEPPVFGSFAGRTPMISLAALDPRDRGPLGRCLSLDPAARPAAAELPALFRD